MTQIAQRYLDLVRRGPSSVGGWLLFLLLVPFSLTYGLIGLLRVWCYRVGFLPSFRSSVPVISVGNLAAGGKGKTPLVDYLARYLLSRGLRVAVVSRGYGGRQQLRVCPVKQHLDTAEATSICGDEPVLLQRRNPKLEVLIARKRADGIRYATEQLSADVVLLDDGFQHLAARRQLDIVMLDAQHPVGNGWPLPAGELREFARAFRRADIMVLSRCSDQDPLPPYYSGPVIRSQHLLEPVAVDLTGGQVPLSVLAGKTGVAFAGIASPEPFFAALSAAGLSLEQTLSLADHVVYDARLIDRLKALAKSADFLVTTEKDGVKLAADTFSLPCYQVPLQLEIISGAEVLHRELDHIVSQGSTMNLTDDLIAILACPKCKGVVTPNEDKTALICPACQLAYPVRDDIPVMLIDEATPV
jgi:tetraacyldisaccharide 4'-kinase